MTSRPRTLTPGQRGVLTALASAVGITALVLGGVLLFRARPTEPVALPTSSTVAPPATTTTTAQAVTTTVPETTTTELETTTTTTTPESTTTTHEILDTFVLTGSTACSSAPNPTL